MDNVKDAQSLSSRPCCAANNFQFITETPSHGFQAGQRFHIRSHVMKRYKQGQKRLQSVKISQARGTERGGHVTILQQGAVEGKRLKEDNESWETLLGGPASRTAQFNPHEEQKPELSFELVSRFRQPDAASRPSMLRTSKIFLDYSSRKGLSQNPPRYRCPYCGTLQAEIFIVDEKQEKGHRSSSESVLWRRELNSSPLEPFGAGRIDPFQSYPVDECKPYLHELMDHAITYLLPGLVPDTENSLVHPVSKAWLSSGLEHPLLFHALAFAGSIHLDYLRSSKIYPNKPLSLSHKLVVIQKVNECLSDPNVASRDEVILAILILASHEAMNMSAGKQNPFNSPLKTAQWLNIYSTITYVPEHMEAVLRLVTLRGGLENIKMFGLAEVIAAGDVVSASNSLSKPSCPLLRSSEAWLDYVETWARAPPRHPVPKLASGFLVLQTIGIETEIMNVLGLLGAVTMAIDHHVRGEPGSLTLGAIAKIRTAAQHRILSLPLSIELQDQFMYNPYIYEACRTTTLIYGIAVIFPVSNAYNLLHELARRLKESLIFLEAENYEPSIAGLCLWMLVLGGIAASDGPERMWFVTQLEILAWKCQICHWNAAEEILQLFLWLESACGAGGRILWTEAMKKIRNTL